MKANSKSQQKRIQAQKPVVHFSGGSSTSHALDVPDAVMGVVFGVSDHPRLGAVPRVYTSEVQKIRIETRNTIYVWEKTDESPLANSVAG